jgi:FixJ family two-component response regulator
MNTAMPLVAVVEDDSASQRTLVRVLRAGGFEAAAYASAEDYLSSPPQSTPLALLLDIHLGGMSGLDLQRRLRDEVRRFR